MKYSEGDLYEAKELTEDKKRPLKIALSPWSSEPYFNTISSHTDIMGTSKVSKDSNDTRCQRIQMIQGVKGFKWYKVSKDSNDTRC